jgi:hypothetical protein
MLNARNYKQVHMLGFKFLFILLHSLHTVAAFGPPLVQLKSITHDHHRLSTILQPSGCYRMRSNIGFAYTYARNNGKTTQMSSSDGNDDSESSPTLTQVALSAGLLAQPIVWISLYFVATTGAGLPTGPLGLLGALEGLSYLLMLAFVGKATYRKAVNGHDENQSETSALVERLSYLSLISGLIVLVSLVLKQGCVPNAKPILDYSGYLPICDTSPGLN